MDHKKLQILVELLEEYRAECQADGLTFLARKVASVRNCAGSDAKDRRKHAVVVITDGLAEGRSTRPAAIAKGVRQIR